MTVEAREAARGLELILDSADSNTARHRLRACAKELVPRALAIRRLRASSTPTVLLTFDDGPDREVTPAVLDRLAAYNARAVFFLVGRRVRRAPEIVDRIRASGHRIGNHTYLHRRRYVQPNPEKPRFASYYQDCVWCQQSIEHAVKERPTLFRPPGGYLTPTTIVVPKLLGMQSMIWSLDVEDWTFQRVEEARRGGQELLRRIAPRDIVLMHDVNPHVVDLLDTLLPGLHERGYDLSAGLDLL
jgi:peptidoglycan/xylan/chitin deacetylase (PgdA/CDA1 family)